MITAINNFNMEYTIENYTKSELPKIGDKVKIGRYTFEVASSASGYYLNGIGCTNDAFIKYIHEDKYLFAEKAVEGCATTNGRGICPYISSINGLAKLIKALWDAAGPKERLLTKKDVFKIGPFEYTILESSQGFFLCIRNSDAMAKRYGFRMGNDGIFRVLGLNKNTLFACATMTHDGYISVPIDSQSSPYAKTIEGINEVISRLQEEYNSFVDDKKKYIKQAKTIAELEKEIPWNCDSSKNSSSKDINITIPKKSNPVKLKIVL